MNLPRREDEQAGWRIVAVGLELLPDTGTNRRGRFLAPSIKLAHSIHRLPKILSGKVRTEIGAVAKNGAILHQTVFLEYVLAFQDVSIGKHRLPLLIDNPLRDGWFLVVKSKGQVAQNGKPDDERQNSNLEPRDRYKHLPVFIVCHSCSP
ncbi:MAG: hypothetical protein M1608_03255 [Candidatus Omnitrophica bacterium]|nr:hypothetical protein [Candidatus Omnitrophota bacterium]